MIFELVIMNLEHLSSKFLGGPVIKTWHIHCRASGSIPSQGTKISQPNKGREFYESNTCLEGHQMVIIKLQNGRQGKKTLIQSLVDFAKDSGPSADPTEREQHNF